MFIDETGVNLGLTRAYGRAAPGVRVRDATPGPHSTRYTLIAALGWQGLQVPWLWQGNLTASIFDDYVECQLAPILREHDIVLADNLSAHKSARARQLIEACGARLVFLPPYSPDLNPIELGWSKAKTLLRAAHPRTWETLVEAVALALRSIQAAEAQAWFAHCGYALS